MSLGKLFEVSPAFAFNTVVSVEELKAHDMIYIYHHIHVGGIVTLLRDGTNVRGDLRFKVSFKGFTLGYATIKGIFQQFYLSIDRIESEIIGLSKQKFLPISGLDICLRATNLPLVS